MPDAREITGPQIINAAGSSGELDNPLPSTFATYRLLRVDPTTAYVRFIRIAIACAGKWSIEVDDDVPDEVTEYIHTTILPHREPIYEATMPAQIDFGFAAFEKVFTLGADGRIVLKKAKPLLHDMTTILVDSTSGAFMGFRQDSVDGTEITIPLENSFLIPFRQEGSNWYGESLLENLRKTQNRYDKIDAASARYNSKIAGAMLTIGYPEGESMFRGTKTPNEDIAAALATEGQSSGAMTYPTSIIEKMGQVTKEKVSSWAIALLSDKASSQAQFVAGMEYQDKQKTRGLLMGERTVMEGKFGTKADAGEHMDAAFSILEMEDRIVARHFNWHVLDQLLALNWGDEMRGKARITPAPLQDEQIALLEKVYQSILKNPGGFAAEFPLVDTDSLKDRIGVPKSKMVADALTDDEGELDDDESKKVTAVAGDPGATE